MRDDDVRMLSIEPGRDGISRRAEDGFDSRVVESIEHAAHPGKLKLAVARFPTAPGGFPDANDGQAGLLHQLDVCVEPVVGRVFRVVRGAIEDGAHAVRRERAALFRQLTPRNRDCNETKRQRGEAAGAPRHSELELQTELDHSAREGRGRRSEVGRVPRVRDLAERRVVHDEHRQRKLRPVEHIEDLDAELGTAA